MADVIWKSFNQAVVSIIAIFLALTFLSFEGITIFAQSFFTANGLITVFFFIFIQIFMSMNWK